MFKIGSLYEIKMYCWFLYPTKEIVSMYVDSCCESRNAVADAAFWSKRRKCKVSYMPENTLIVPLEIHGQYIKAAAGASRQAQAVSG